MARIADRRRIIVREEERGYAAAAHFIGAVPLWGFLGLAAVWIYFKERSREVVFHVQQAMMFQLLFLCVAVFAVAVALLIMPIGVLHEGVAEFLARMNLRFLVLSYAVYATTCVVGAVMTFLGRPFLYPLVGRRMLEGGTNKSLPEV